MRYGKEEIYQLLETEKILFEKVEHPAVYTIDGMKDLHLPNEEAVAKNLFVRDKKKKQYYLIVLREDKHCDLKALQEKVGSDKPLGFASEEDLDRILGLIRGSVTPLGALNDEERRVRVIVDATFAGQLIGMHPNDNTASVWLRADILMDLLQRHGCQAEWMEL